MQPLSRRAFLGAGAGTVGGLLLADHLRFFEVSAQTQEAASLTEAAEAVFRTGHSNNCDGACGHLVHTKGGRVTLVEPAPWGTTTIAGQPVPPFSPRICLRGLSQISNTYSPDRLKYPYQRVGPRGSGQWKRITWDEAASIIATNLKAIQKKHGPKSVWVAPYTGSLSLIEGVVGAGFRFASVIGASAGDFEGDNEGDSATPAGWNYVLVDPANPANGGGFFDGHESTDFLNAQVIVFWANNVAETSIPDWRIMLDAREQHGTRLVSIDPRFTPTSAACDDWLPIRPGADTALIDGIIRYVLTNHLYDANYLRSYTVAPYLIHPQTKKWLRAQDVLPGYKKDDYVVFDQAGGTIKAASDPTLKDPALLGVHPVAGMQARTALQALADAVAPYTPEHTATLTDLTPAQVTSLATLWGTNRPVAVRVGFGLSHWYRGDLSMQALLTLQALTGNIGVHGGGVTTFAGGLTTTAFDLAGWWAPNGRMFSVLEPMNACDAMLEGTPYPVSGLVYGR
jgi:nitrate reductase alpha subunit